MEIIPAIDIMGGKCVQLVGGDPKTRKDYGDPEKVALEWKAKGARMLHLVDLDATLGEGNNFGEIIKVRRTANLPIEFGGGIRTLPAAKGALYALKQEDRVIVGTMAVNEYPDFKTLKELAKFKGRIIASVDSKDGYVTTKGWTEKSTLKTTELINAIEPYVWGFLFTNVNVEGQMKGIDGKAVRDVVDAADKPVIVSGGISSKDDVKACDNAGAWGVVLGKALYEGKIKLEELI